MIDVPVPVYVEYKNLSSIVLQSERQKDIISTVLKRLEGSSRTIFELTRQTFEKENVGSIRYYWQARCVVCFTPETDQQGVILSSIHKVFHENTEQSDIYFDTVDSIGKVAAWKIDLVEVKPFLVRSGESVKVHFHNTNGIQIDGVGKSLKNGKKGDMIHVQIKSFFKGNDRANSSEIIEAKVTSTHEVEYVGK